MCKGGNFPCYAYRLANGRLKERYLANPNVAPRYEEDGARFNLYEDLHDPFYPRFWSDRCNRSDMVPGRSPKGIFVCDMGDLFGIGVPEEWTHRVLDRCKDMPQHRFYLLTKQPQNLTRFSPFPDNCWVGVTATDTGMLLQACSSLEYPVEAKVKYLSIEPFLGWSFNWNESYLINAFKRAGINWIIIGQQTPINKKTKPQIEWVQEIVEAADKAGVAVFLKDNLNPMFAENDCKLFKEHRDTLFTFKDFESDSKTRWHLRQEIPK